MCNLIQNVTAIMHRTYTRFDFHRVFHSTVGNERITVKLTRSGLDGRRPVLRLQPGDRVLLQGPRRTRTSGSSSSPAATCRGGWPAPPWWPPPSPPTRRWRSPGMVARNGIAGNWLWWNFVASGMLTVFFYARLWRRSGVMTDIEFAEIRYAGKPGRLPARLSRPLPRHPHQLHHPGLGEPGHGEDPDADPWAWASSRRLRSCWG